VPTKVKSEHGLSIYIEFQGKKILFDSGKSDLLVENAEKMNIELENLDFIVLSHGHYDHTGGVNNLLTITHPTDIYVGPTFFVDKYKIDSNDCYKFIGNNFCQSDLKKNQFGCIEVNSKITKISEKIYVFSGFKRKVNFDDNDEHFFVKEQDTFTTDKFIDEIVLGLEVPEGLFLVVGCSHIGIVNIIESIKEIVDTKVIGFIGGTHLRNASSVRIESVNNYFRESEFRYIISNHCTGTNALAFFKENLKEKYIESHVGSILEI
jgi:7,8-dihydropterin-6-yl-methyl-4-(beta-D-ribofuranosyl)aminobenzene 5'-phosphate synthase